MRWLRELRCERDIPFAEQRAVVGELVARYRPVRVAVDQTGMGEAFVEALQERHGRHRVEGALLAAPRRLDLAAALKEALEDRRLRLPPDEALRRDLHAVRAETGPTGAPRLVADRAGTDGHADRFWALALAVAAAAAPPAEFGYRPVAAAARRRDPWDEDGDAAASGRWGAVAGRARFGPGAP